MYLNPRDIIFFSWNGQPDNSLSSLQLHLVQFQSFWRTQHHRSPFQIHFSKKLTCNTTKALKKKKKKYIEMCPRISKLPLSRSLIHSLFYFKDIENVSYNFIFYRWKYITYYHIYTGLILWFLRAMKMAKLATTNASGSWKRGQLRNWFKFQAKYRDGIVW